MKREVYMNIFYDYEKLSKEQKIEENKKLLDKYPFLLPRNVWTDEVLEDYNYEYTIMDEIPIGWRIAFGELFFDELLEELKRVDFIDQYRVLQVKEKFGTFRWYTGGVPQNSTLHDIADKYEELSANICIDCGKPNVPMVNESWISPYCFECWSKQYIDYWKKTIPEKDIEDYAKQKYTEFTNDNDSNIIKIIKWTVFNKEGQSIRTLDATTTVNKIIEAYKQREGIECEN